MNAGERRLTRLFSVCPRMSPVLVGAIVPAQFRHIKKLGQQPRNFRKSPNLDVFKSGKTRSLCYEFRNR